MVGATENVSLRDKGLLTRTHSGENQGLKSAILVVRFWFLVKLETSSDYIECSVVCDARPQNRENDVGLGDFKGRQQLKMLFGNRKTLRLNARSD